MSIDLNADLGERPRLTPADLAVMESVTSVSIACGHHAGSVEVMGETARACLERAIVIGAHVSYRDREGFGRRSVEVTPDELYAGVVEQYQALSAIVRALGGAVSFVKPHGALYNDMAIDGERSVAVVEAMTAVGIDVLVTQGLGPVPAVAARAGIRVVLEGFPDRGYLSDGRLAPRSAPGGLVDDPTAAASRAVAMARGAPLEAVDGGVLRLAVHTLCIHGDAPDAAARAAAVRRHLERSRVEIAAFVSAGPH